MKADQVNFENSTRLWFYFTLLFLVIDYGRPQDIVPIGFLRPGMIAAVVLFFFLVVKDHGPEKIFSNTQFRMLIYFVLLMACYIPFAVNNFFAYFNTKFMAILLPFIFSMYICINSMKRLKVMIALMIGLMLYMAIYAILHNGRGSGGQFSDENDLSLYINTYLPFCYYLFYYENNNWKKLLYLAFALIGLMAIVVSLSRGGFVGLVAMLMAVWLLSNKKLFILIAALLIFILVSTYVMQTAYFQEMGTIANTDEGTANERMLSWKAAWYMFLDNPLGVGPGNFPVRFPEYQASDFERGMWGRVAHSLWFTLLPELGIVGVFIYLRMVFANLGDLFYIRRLNTVGQNDLKYLRSLSLALIVSMVGFFASATFISVLYYPHYFYLTALVVIITRLSKELHDK